MLQRRVRNTHNAVQLLVPRGRRLRGGGQDGLHGFFGNVLFRIYPDRFALVKGFDDRVHMSFSSLTIQTAAAGISLCRALFYPALRHRSMPFSKLTLSLPLSLSQER